MRRPAFRPLTVSVLLVLCGSSASAQDEGKGTPCPVTRQVKRSWCLKCDRYVTKRFIATVEGKQRHRSKVTAKSCDGEVAVVQVCLRLYAQCRKCKKTDGTPKPCCDGKKMFRRYSHARVSWRCETCSTSASDRAQLKHAEGCAAPKPAVTCSLSGKFPHVGAPK